MITLTSDDMIECNQEICLIWSERISHKQYKCDGFMNFDEEERSIGGFCQQKRFSTSEKKNMIFIKVMDYLRRI